MRRAARGDSHIRKNPVGIRAGRRRYRVGWKLRRQYSFRCPVAEGDHIVTVKKFGFKDWRKMKVSAGSSVHLNAELEKAATQ